MELSTKQTELVKALEARKIDARWNGQFLNCTTTLHKCDSSGNRTGKTRKIRWGLSFDDPDEVFGARVCDRNRQKAYVDKFSRDSFFEALRIGHGDDEALKFVNKCRADSLWHGAPDWWLDQHSNELISATDDDKE